MNKENQPLVKDEPVEKFKFLAVYISRSNEIYSWDSQLPESMGGNQISRKHSILTNQFEGFRDLFDSLVLF